MKRLKENIQQEHQGPGFKTQGAQVGLKKKMSPLPALEGMLDESRRSMKMKRGCAVSGAVQKSAHSRGRHWVINKTEFPQQIMRAIKGAISRPRPACTYQIDVSQQHISLQIDFSYKEKKERWFPSSNES